MCVIFFFFHDLFRNRVFRQKSWEINKFLMYIFLKVFQQKFTKISISIPTHNGIKFSQKKTCAKNFSWLFNTSISTTNFFSLWHFSHFFWIILIIHTFMIGLYHNSSYELFESEKYYDLSEFCLLFMITL